MSGQGADVLEIGASRVGQTYVFGANVPLNNAHWSGPWDCAEFASWCVYQAYGLVFGAGRPKTVASAEPFSGYWHDEAVKYGTVIDWKAALKIPGAVLIRKPAPGLIGHVALSMGDGERTLEARSSKLGVNIFPEAAARAWTIGCLLPGVEYGKAAPPVGKGAAVDLPGGYLWLKKPVLKGPEVVAAQQALIAKGISPGPLDGEYGPMVSAAVTSFQAAGGLEVDGAIGPNTARALGLSFPIIPSAADIALWKALTQRAAPPAPVAAPASTIDAVVAVVANGKAFEARTQQGVTFLVGRTTKYTDDMARTGLYQSGAEIQDSLRFGVFKASNFTGAFGQWAWLISPTLAAEGEARFATLNTYDRAAFTFGAPQFAAHTPKDNFVNYFRMLLALPNAAAHFPDLVLKANAKGATTIHEKRNGAFTDLEQEVVVVRPNGKKETQIPYLMKYLNPSPTAVDEAELLAAARLMNWLRLDPQASALQVYLFIEQSRRRLATAKTQVPDFSGSDWREALWINDILHQGRGSYAAMKLALAKPAGARVAALAEIGKASYPGRVKKIAAEIAALNAGGQLQGFTV
jgi:hypothetical protein